MNHPQREEWVPFIFGEASQETKRRLRDHLQTCPTCAREVEAWRRSLRHLDTWRLPKVAAPVVISAQPVLKWALAALVVVGLGVLGARLNTAATTAQLRAGLEASLQAKMQDQLNSTLLQIQEQNAKALNATELRLAQASVSERERLWRGFLEVLNNARATDTKTMQTALRQLEQRDGTEFVALRKDLETLASTTDDAIQFARLKLIQLATAAPQEKTD